MNDKITPTNIKLFITYLKFVNLFNAPEVPLTLLKRLDIDQKKKLREHKKEIKSARGRVRER